MFFGIRKAVVFQIATLWICKSALSQSMPQTQKPAPSPQAASASGASVQPVALSLPDPISDREISRYGRILGLSSEQESALANWHKEYLSRWKSLDEVEMPGVRDRAIEAGRAIGVGWNQASVEACQAFDDAESKLSEHQQRLDSQLFDQLSLILADAQ